MLLDIHMLMAAASGREGNVYQNVLGQYFHQPYDAKCQRIIFSC